MKGFPNQIADIKKITMALDILSGLLNSNSSTDDQTLGESLLFNKVIKAGKSGETIDTYLDRMSNLSPSNQGYRTTARGLKEFLTRVGLIQRVNEDIILTHLGRELLESWSTENNNRLRQVWKSSMRQATAEDDFGISHPYRIMLRLLDERPGTQRALCALALEAENDSEEEFQRILYLHDLEDEDAIRARLSVTKSNWDNAKKILPSIAEQLGDVVRDGQELHLASEGTSVATKAVNSSPVVPARRTSTSRIASWRKPDKTDEITELQGSLSIDPASWTEAIARRSDRTDRHNRIVRRFAETLIGLEALWEDPFDCLAVAENKLILVEVKTLDGSIPDEVRQVRYAAGQLRYYEYFAIPASLLSNSNCGIVKVAVFERRPADYHVCWLESLAIVTVWTDGSTFRARKDHAGKLSRYIDFSAA